MNNMSPPITVTSGPSIVCRTNCGSNGPTVSSRHTTLEGRSVSETDSCTSPPELCETLDHAHESFADHRFSSSCPVFHLRVFPVGLRSRSVPEHKHSRIKCDLCNAVCRKILGLSHTTITHTGTVFQQRLWSTSCPSKFQTVLIDNFFAQVWKHQKSNNDRSYSCTTLDLQLLLSLCGSTHTAASQWEACICWFDCTAATVLLSSSNVQLKTRPDCGAKSGADLRRKHKHKRDKAKWRIGAVSKATSAHGTPLFAELRTIRYFEETHTSGKKYGNRHSSELMLYPRQNTWLGVRRSVAWWRIGHHADSHIVTAEQNCKMVNQTRIIPQIVEVLQDVRERTRSVCANTIWY